MRIAFGVNHHFFLRSHRYAIVQEARARGWETHILTGPWSDPRDGRAAADFVALGCELHEIDLSRTGTSPGDLLGTARAIERVYRSIRPDIAHHITPKVVSLGAIGARRAGVPALVNAISGLGFMFSGDGLRARARSLGASTLYAYALRHPNQAVIVQNERDLAALRRLRLPEGTRFEHLAGSGVDLERFRATPVPHADGATAAPIVVLPARMVPDKGIHTFVEAAGILRRNGVRVRMVLCGPLDPGNPKAFSPDELSALTSGETHVEWWGHRDDMPTVYAEASIVALPSYYGEGLPLALAEAAAAGRPIITTDLPGCRDTVVDGESGVLIPAKDAAALASAITSLVGDPPRAAAMGRRGRTLAEDRFALRDVVDRHFELYEWLHGRIRAAA